VDRERIPVVAGYVALFLLGVVLAAWETFLVPLRLPGGVEGLSVLLAFAGNVGAGALGQFGFGTPLAAAMPGLGWLPAVLVLGGGAPGHAGDVLIPARIATDPGVSKVGIGFMIAGAIGAVVAVVRAGWGRPAASPPA
jgi:hypothetical protein